MNRLYKKMRALSLGAAFSCAWTFANFAMAQPPVAQVQNDTKTDKTVPTTQAKVVKRKAPANKARLGTWRGYLTGRNTPRKFGFVMQHPMVAGFHRGPGPRLKQTYLTLVKGSKVSGQIIITYKGKELPLDTSRPVEITGISRRLGASARAKKALSKRSHTRHRRRRGKSSYRGLVVRVKSWKYLSKTP